MIKFHFHQEENIEEVEYTSVFQSGNSYYEYLSDMRFDEDDNCDYCAAFMFVQPLIVFTIKRKQGDNLSYDEIL